MEQLPKIVVQRLRATAKPEVHPDPDLLAAFAENSIGDRERTVVMEHLAQCADCREVVTLAQPEFERAHAAAASAVPAAALPAATASAKTSSRRSWSRAPIFRWGALAACAAVVAVGGLTLRRQSLARRDEAAKEEMTVKLQPPGQQEYAAKVEPAPPPAPAARVMEPTASPAAAAHASGAAARKKDAETALASPKPAPTVMARNAPPQSRGLGRGTFSGMDDRAEVIRKQQELLRAEQDELSNSMENRPAGQANRRSSSEGDQASAAAVRGGEVNQVTVESAQAKAAAAPAAAAPPPPSTAADKLSRTPAALGALGMSKNAKALGAVAVVAPRWSLSPDGKVLLQSTDAGKTWRKIPVADAVVLRAVFALGPEVWVGGAGGVLYHSSNTGQDWMKVEPMAGGKMLQDDIATVEFTDLLHGQVTTVNHEVWTTNDGGKSWQFNTK